MTTTVNKSAKGNLEVKYPLVYKDIKSKIEKGILSGTLPSARELAADYNVNFMTVNKAIKKLESDGLVTCIPRKGTYIKRHCSVAVCSNDPHVSVLSSKIYNHVIIAAQRYFSEHNCPMYLEGSLLHKENVAEVLNKRIDGFLLFYNEDFPLPESLLHMPHVRLMGNYNKDAAHDHVTYDNSRVGEIAAEYLWEQECRSAAYIGPYGMKLFDRRRNAFIARFKALGGKIYEFPGKWDFEMESMQRQVENVLACKKLPDAIFVPTDNVIAIVCGILLKKNIQPEEHFKFIGCNNLSTYPHFLMDRFATIELFPDKIGRLGAAQLLKRISDPDLPQYIKIIEPEIVLPGKKREYRNED